jgi:hypothetical protein
MASIALIDLSLDSCMLNYLLEDGVLQWCMWVSTRSSWRIHSCFPG